MCETVELTKVNIEKEQFEMYSSCRPVCLLPDPAVLTIENCFTEICSNFSRYIGYHPTAFPRTHHICQNLTKECRIRGHNLGPAKYRMDMVTYSFVQRSINWHSSFDVLQNKRWRLSRKWWPRRITICIMRLGYCCLTHNRRQRKCTATSLPRLAAVCYIASSLDAYF